MTCFKFMTFCDSGFLLMLIVGYEGGWHVKCLRSWLYTSLFCPWFINQSSPNPCQYECDVSQVEWWKCLFTDGTSWRKYNSAQLLYSFIICSGSEKIFGSYPWFPVSRPPFLYIIYIYGDFSCELYSPKLSSRWIQCHNGHEFSRCYGVNAPGFSQISVYYTLVHLRHILVFEQQSIYC